MGVFVGGGEGLIKPNDLGFELIIFLPVPLALTVAIPYLHLIERS